jgi:hypothetical protein
MVRREFRANHNAAVLFAQRARAPAGSAEAVKRRLTTTVETVRPKEISLAERSFVGAKYLARPQIEFLESTPENR